MSLINEALKRTRDASYQAATPRPTGREPYRVSPTVTSNRPRTKPIVWVMFGVMTLAVIASAFVFSRVNKIDKTLEQTFQAPAPVVVPVVPPPVEPITPEPATAPAPVSVTPPEPPKLILQGITVDPLTGREALINGVNLHVGDEIDGAKVLTIEARRVVLRFHDHELTLRIP